MEKIIALYKLRQGVTREGFAAWSRDVDQRNALRQEACIRFELYGIEGTPALPATGPDVPFPEFDILEDIEVESWEAWDEALKSDAMRGVLEQFGTYVDESSVYVLRGRRLP